MSIPEHHGVKLFEAPLSPGDDFTSITVDPSFLTSDSRAPVNPRGQPGSDEEFRTFSQFKKIFNNCHCLSLLTKRRFKNENMIVLSLIQMLCGLAAIIFSSIAITKGVFLYKMATGLWAGFIMIATGTHGLLTAFRTQVCTLISLLVWSILSSLTSTLLICVSIAGLIEDSEKIQHLQITSPHEFVGQQMYFTSPMRFHQIILHILLLIVGCLEASVGLSTAIFCCKTLCPVRSNALKSNYSNFLIAVPDGKTEREENLPYLYSNVSSFFPKSPENSVVLTHYDSSNNGAITAAQAATRYLNHLAQQKGVPMITNSNNLDALFNKRTSRGRRRARPSNMKILSYKRKNIRTLNKLFKESLQTNLVYVMPSPNREDPPTLFPPFPPSYAKSSITSPHNQLKITSNHLQNEDLGQLLHSLNQISPRNCLNANSNGPGPRMPQQSPSSMYQINGDRILHPVLIIERPEPKPPSYDEGGQISQVQYCLQTATKLQGSNESLPSYVSRNENPY